MIHQRNITSPQWNFRGRGMFICMMLWTQLDGDLYVFLATRGSGIATMAGTPSQGRKNQIPAKGNEHGMITYLCLKFGRFPLGYQQPFHTSVS